MGQPQVGQVLEGGANVFCQLSSHAIAYVLSVEAISFTMRIYCTDQAHIRVE